MKLASTKYLIIIVSAVFLIVFSLYFNFEREVTPISEYKLTEKSTGNIDMIKISLIIDFGEGDSSYFPEVRLPASSTVFTLLKTITNNQNLEFSYQDYGSNMGAMIESIDYKKNGDDSRWWQYWVNDSYAQIGASNFILHGGDKVEWKYGKDADLQ